MGALHKGHGSLIDAAKLRANRVAVSIFVNPTQFNNASDFDKYPRQHETDLAFLKEKGVDFVFIPDSPEEVYPEGYELFDMDFGRVGKVMEGEFRPGHFKGVANVVFQFFQIIQPEYALFGLKDYQQYLIVKMMAENKGLDVQVIGVPTFRESTGLAMSSRNLRLSEAEKQESAIIYQCFQEAKKQLKELEVEDVLATIQSRFLEKQNMALEYFQIVDPETLEPLKGKLQHGQKALGLAAAFVGDVRLIDNEMIID